jgi:hypothetical protein
MPASKLAKLLSVARFMKAGEHPQRELISAVRTEHGLTTSEAAELCVSHYRTYVGWEAGDSRMHPAIWLHFLRSIAELPQTEEAS